MISCRLLTAVLVAVFAVLIAVIATTLGSYEGRPEGPAPHEAVPLWRNSDLTFGNKVLEYMFPLICPIGSMIKCSTTHADPECMAKARESIKTGNDQAWQSMLDAETHTETVVTIERDGDYSIEVVLLSSVNTTVTNASPLIFWLHGGGFTAGSARDSYMLGVMKGLEEAVGNDKVRNAVWATIEYSLAPERKFPAAPDDCFHAIDYLLGKFRLDDGSRLGGGGVHVAGTSAGATLAVMAAQQALQEGLDVDSILADNLVLPLNTKAEIGSVFDSPSYRRNWYTRIPPQRWTDWILKAYTGYEENHANETFIRGTLSAAEWRKVPNLPPIIVVTCKADLFRDTAFPFIDLYTEVAGAERIHHIDAKASHALHLFFDTDAASTLFSTWGGIISQSMTA